MNIVYMGTPDFAVPSLAIIIQSQHQVVGVITQPDRPKGRGQRLKPPPVKILAEKHNIPVHQPEKIRTPAFLSLLEKLKPDLIVVVAYGKILPKAILTLPAQGCVNVHASLLPKYRGAAPIHWAVINGEQQTGITTIYMDEGLDTGDIILCNPLAIEADHTVGEVHDRLAVLGAKVLVETLAAIAGGHAPRKPQNHSQATDAPLLRREHEVINWQHPATTIKNQIRGMNPWPGTFTKLAGEVLKVWQAEVVSDYKETGTEQPGTVVSTDNNCLVVQTGAGLISLLELQLQGKKRLPASEFLRGKTVSVGVCFKIN